MHMKEFEHFPKQRPKQVYTMQNNIENLIEATDIEDELGIIMSVLRDQKRVLEALQRQIVVREGRESNGSEGEDANTDNGDDELGPDPTCLTHEFIGETVLKDTQAVSRVVDVVDEHMQAVEVL